MTALHINRKRFGDKKHRIFNLMMAAVLVVALSKINLADKFTDTMETFKE